jgi:hypothetical protein
MANRIVNIHGARTAMIDVVTGTGGSWDLWVDYSHGGSGNGWRELYVHLCRYGVKFEGMRNWCFKEVG